MNFFWLLKNLLKFSSDSHINIANQIRLLLKSQGGVRTNRLDSPLFLTCDPPAKAYLLSCSLGIAGGFTRLIVYRIIIVIVHATVITCDDSPSTTTSRRQTDGDRHRADDCSTHAAMPLRAV
jgi:hypothetical protein